jgi:nucleotide-binding universal stress UspA family protein
VTENTIVVAVNSSAQAYAALRWALTEANRRGDGLLAVNVLDRGRRADWRLERDPDAEFHEQQERLGAQVSRAVKEHEVATGEPVPPVQVLVVQGDLVHVLGRLASDAHMLVLGRAQRRTPEAMAQELGTHCPVMLIDEQGAASHAA